MSYKADKVLIEHLFYKLEKNKHQEKELILTALQKSVTNVDLQRKQHNSPRNKGGYYSASRIQKSQGIMPDKQFVRKHNNNSLRGQFFTEQ